MRVLHVLGELKASGAEVMLRSAMPLFRQQGVETHVLSTGQHPGSYAVELEAAGCRIHHIPFSKSPVFFARLLHFMRDGEFQVIHLHTERANFWLGLVALGSGASRVIRTVHNVFSFTGGLRRTRAWQRRLLGRLGVAHVTISPTVLDNELRRFGARSWLMDNWYDDTRFSLCTTEERAQAREKLGLHDGQQVFISIGNCSEVKNHRALLEALARMSPQLDWVYLHLGEEEADAGERRLAESLGIDARVRFLGRQPEPRQYLAAADVYVMPSVYEGFGVAAMEALAMGIPCVFSDVDGLCDFKDIFGDIVYSGTDAQTIAAALEIVCAWPEERRIQVRERFAATAYEQFRTERGVAGYLNLYRGGETA